MAFTFTAPPLTAGQDKPESHLLDQNTINGIKDALSRDESTGKSVLKAFFSKVDLNSLLNPPVPIPTTPNPQPAASMVGGLRFYPGMNSLQVPSLQAIASTTERADLVFGSNYSVILAESDGSANTTGSSILNQDQCVAKLEEYRDKVKDSQLNGSAEMPLSRTPSTDMPRNYSKIFFQRTAIENLLNTANASGIRFYEAIIDFNDGKEKVSTLAAVAVDQNGNDLDNAVLSALPCPPDCGGGGYTDDNLFATTTNDNNPT
ncbi:MAG TPA: hypothetical protein PKA00_09685 [Saprospiraceae bacterium]|nr:hypothetical protein [Saprospiraceae bacterium]HMQ83170.1 hypothetical protein [Saprospiraceae bacterium]